MLCSLLNALSICSVPCSFVRCFIPRFNALPLSQILKWTVPSMRGLRTKHGISIKWLKMRMWFTVQPTFTITSTCIACFPFNIKQPTSWVIALRILLSAKYSSPTCYGSPREFFYVVLTMPSLPSSITEIEGIAWGADMPSATRT